MIEISVKEDNKSLINLKLIPLKDNEEKIFRYKCSRIGKSPIYGEIKQKEDDSLEKILSEIFKRIK